MLRTTFLALALVVASGCIDLDDSDPTVGEDATGIRVPPINGPWLEDQVLQGVSIGERVAGEMPAGYSVRGTRLCTLVTTYNTKTGFPYSYWSCPNLPTFSIVSADGKYHYQARTTSTWAEGTSTRLWNATAGDNYDVQNYMVEYYNPLSATWNNLCNGGTSAIFLQGYWNNSGSWVDSSSLFTIACGNGALNKCAKWGYKPWRTATDPGGHSVDLRPLHQACSRAVRADYCGNGQSFTQPATAIEVYDNLKLMQKAPESDYTQAFSFESSFDGAGSICLVQQRWTSIAPTSTCTPTAISSGGAALACVILWGGLHPDSPSFNINTSYDSGARWVFVDTSTVCPHLTNVQGGPLAQNCNACSDYICQRDSYCCQVGWDAQCRNESAGWCGF